MPENTSAKKKASGHETTSLNRRTVLRLMGAGALASAMSFGLPADNIAQAAKQPAPPAGAPFWNPAGMDALSAIFTRRTHREFTGDPMPKETLRSIIAAGMNAPSANNSRPWRFVTFTEKDSLNRIPSIIPMTGYAKKAAAAVLICADTGANSSHELMLMSLACCGQNMLLACHALGYGGVWLEVFPNQNYVKAWSQVAELPNTILPITLLVMGKAANQIPPVNRMEPEWIQNETWKNNA